MDAVTQESPVNLFGDIQNVPRSVRIRDWFRSNLNIRLFYQIQGIVYLALYATLVGVTVPRMWRAWNPSKPDSSNATCEMELVPELTIFTHVFLAVDVILRLYSSFLPPQPPQPGRRRTDIPFWRLVAFMLLYPTATTTAMDLPDFECDPRLANAFLWQWRYITLIILTSGLAAIFIGWVNPTVFDRGAHPRPSPLTLSDLRSLPRMEFQAAKQLMHFGPNAQTSEANTSLPPVPAPPNSTNPDASGQGRAMPLLGGQISASPVEEGRSDPPPALMGAPAAAGGDGLTALDRMMSPAASRHASASAPPPGRSGTAVTAEADQCPVCLDDFEPTSEVLLLPCKHCFHSSCVATWLVQTALCPVCREGVRPVHPSQR